MEERKNGKVEVWRAVRIEIEIALELEIVTNRLSYSGVSEYVCPQISQIYADWDVARGWSADPPRLRHNANCGMPPAKWVAGVSIHAWVLQPLT